MEHLSRKERRKQQRRQQLTPTPEGASLRSSGAKELLWVLGAIIVVIGGFFTLFWYTSTPKLGEAYQNQGREHIAVDADHIDYNSNPPTSGPHAQEVDWGIYDEELPDERLIHNIEHGGIWISYKEISDGELEELKEIAKAYPQRIVLTPRSKNDDKIALTSWKRLLRLEMVDKEKIIEFIEKNTNKSPERLAR